MKKVLVVAYFFPPIAASGSIRLLGFCRYLERYGWQPRVLTTDTVSVYPPHLVDEGLCHGLPAALHVDRVPYRNPLHEAIRARDHLRNKIRACFNSRSGTARAEEKREEVSGTRGRLSVLKDLALDRIFSFPDPQCFWLRPAVRKLSTLPFRDRPDVVFASGKPWTGLLVGKTIAQRFRVPLVADFRDPWTNNPTENLAPSLARSAKKLERRVCGFADRVVSTTPELSDHFSAEYPDFSDKFVTITNGFDGASFGPLLEEKTDSARPAEEESFLELTHFGSIYPNRSPMALLRAIKELLQEKKIQRGRLRLRFVGGWDAANASCEALAQELEKEGAILREPPLPHDVCLRQMASAQMLLVVQPAFPLQIPGKIYEYIASGRPLVVIGGEGATANLVERHRLGKCCPNETAEIKRLLSGLTNGDIRIDPPPSTDRKRFDYQSLAGELAAVLDSACAKSKVATEMVCNLT